MYFEFGSHIKSTNLSLCSILACKYALDMSNILIILSLYASIMNNLSVPSLDTLGEATESSSFRYFCCLLPFAHNPPLLFLLFFFYQIYCFHCHFFSSQMIILASTGITTGFPGNAPWSNCWNSFIIVLIALCPNSLIPFLVLICDDKNKYLPVPFGRTDACHIVPSLLLLSITLLLPYVFVSCYSSFVSSVQIVLICSSDSLCHHDLLSTSLNIHFIVICLHFIISVTSFILSGSSLITFLSVYSSSINSFLSLLWIYLCI